RELQPAVRQARRHRPGAVDGAARRPGRRLRGRHARRARRRHRAGRHQRERRAAPAAGHRPGAGAPARRVPLRRLLLGPGRGHRRPAAGGAGALHPGGGGHRRGPAGVDDPSRRPDRGAGGRRCRRPRHPRRAARQLSDLRGDRRLAATGGSGVTTKTAPPEAPKPAPLPQQRLGSGVGRWGALGMPAEKTANFGQSLRRLLAMLRRERLGFVAVVVLAVASVTLSVLGPKMLGRATDVIFQGLTHGGAAAIDFGSLHRALWLVVGLYVVASVFGYVQSYVLAGIVQRTMYRLREDVETKLNRLPLRYVDGQARGDLLSRVTNDIDNLAQG